MRKRSHCNIRIALWKVCKIYNKYVEKIILLENMFYMRENLACNIVPKYARIITPFSRDKTLLMYLFG